MKLKYLSSIILSALMFAGCSEDNTLGSLGTMVLDKTYVTIPEAGGDVSVTINATEDWAFDKTFQVITTKPDKSKDTTYHALPTWLKASAEAGPAGKSVVTLHADASAGGREAELQITVGGQKQFLMVRQGSLEASAATCAQVIAGVDGKSYRVKGTVANISNTLYGNWDLVDPTGMLVIYGTLDKDGKPKNFESLGIEVGDEVVVEGPKLTYPPKVELVNVTVLSIKKSLIKLVETAPQNIKKEGETFKVKVAYKGKGVFMSIADEYKSWLKVTNMDYVPGVPSKTVPNPADTAIVTLVAGENIGGARTGKLTLTSSDAKNSSSVDVTVTQEGAIMALKVSDFIASPVGKNQYRLSGMVTKVLDAAKGNVYIKDFSGEVYAYKLADVAAKGVKVGDIVTVVGQRGEYKGTIQLVEGIIENVISNTKATIAEVLAKPDDPKTYFMVTGTIKEITGIDYGNLKLTDATGEIEVYGVHPGYGATGDNRKGLAKTLGLKAGDQLTIIGTKGSYKGKLQMVNSFYFSHTAQ